MMNFGGVYVSYQQYGISKQLVERVKLKMKDPYISDRIKKLVEGLTKSDLQNRSKVKSLILQGSKIVAIPLSAAQVENIANFVLAQKIDPKNTFHLIRLWSMFR